jgi:hypothetical protein
MSEGRHPATALHQAPNEQQHFGDHKNNGAKRCDQEQARSVEVSCQKHNHVIQGCIAADSL